MTFGATRTAKKLPRASKPYSEAPPSADQITLMCDSALFAGLSPVDCGEIFRSGRMRTYLHDEVLFLQGQPVDTLLLIQSGTVKLTQLNFDGNEVILWINGSGAALALHDYAGNCNHTCSARAMNKCQTILWERDRFQSLVARYPQIDANILRVLGDQLRELEERFLQIATEKAANRLALQLVRLIQLLGRQSKDGVELGLKREELAQMTGMTLFTISRILSKWSESGFVIPRRESVVIREPKDLLAESHDFYRGK